MKAFLIRETLALCLITIACGGAVEEDADAWRGTIEEADGVVFVENPAEGLWDDRDPQAIRFELEQVFGVDQEPAEAILARVSAVVVDGAGRVYVLDGRDSRLVAFEPDGSISWTAGRQGQGPGELLRPASLVWDGGSTLYVSDQYGARVQSWDTNGNLLDSRSTDSLELAGADPVGFVRPGALVFIGSVPGSVAAEVTVLSLDGEWEVESRFVVDVGGGKPTPGQPKPGPKTSDKTTPSRTKPGSMEPGPPGPGPTGVPATRVAGGTIRLGDMDSYDLTFYDSTGGLTRVIRRNVDFMVGFSGESARSSASNLWPPLELESGHLLAYAAWAATGGPNAPPQEWRSSVDLFDPEGRFLFSRVYEGPQWPEIGRPWLIGPDGKLYTTLSDPFPQVRRYQVVIAE